jgi:Flp pilus assembly protein TadD
MGMLGSMLPVRLLFGIRVRISTLFFLHALTLFSMNVPAIGAESLVADGFKLLEDGQAAAARNLFDKSLKSNPDDPKALEGMAYACNQLGYYSLAGWYADRRWTLAPSDRLWRQKRALLLFDARPRRDEALSEARRLVSEQPSDVDAHFLLGRLLAWIGKNTEARKSLEFVLSRTPNNVEALHNLARVESREYNYEKAFHLLQRAVRLKSDDSNLKTQLADTGILAKRFRVARYEPTIAMILGIIGFSIVMGQTSARLAARRYWSILTTMMLLAAAIVVWLHVIAI